jgi:hypothetical protein
MGLMRFNSVSNREIFSNPAGKVAAIYPVNGLQ